MIERVFDNVWYREPASCGGVCTNVGRRRVPRIVADGQKDGFSNTGPCPVCSHGLRIDPLGSRTCKLPEMGITKDENPRIRELVYLPTVAGARRHKEPKPGPECLG